MYEVRVRNIFLYDDRERIKVTTKNLKFNKASLAARNLKKVNFGMLQCTKKEFEINLNHTSLFNDNISKYLIFRFSS